MSARRWFVLSSIATWMHGQREAKVMHWFDPKVGKTACGLEFKDNFVRMSGPPEPRCEACTRARRDRNKFCVVAVPGGFCAGRPGETRKVYHTSFDAIAALSKEEDERIAAAEPGALS